MVRIKKAGKGSSSRRKVRRRDLQEPVQDGAVDEKKGEKRTRKRGRDQADQAKATAKEGDGRSTKKSRTEVASEAKLIWERLRNRKELESGSAPGLVTKLLKLLLNDLEGFAHRHDTSRVLQWTLKAGNKEQRREVIDALLPNVAALSGDRYGRHVVLSSLVPGRASRVELLAMFEKFRGNVLTMVKNAHSAEVLDTFYQTTANSSQKKMLYLELLHGHQTKLLSTQQKHNTRAASLEEAVDALGPEFGRLLVEAARDILTNLSEKEGSLQQAIIHDALYDYIQYSLKHNKQAAVDVAVSYAPLAAELAHTKSGAASVVLIVKLTDAKNRKKLIKALQEKIRRIAEDNHGHVVPMAIYEHVDDTKLTQKSILKAHLGKSDAETLEVLLHRYASLPILNLLAPHESRYFNPALYEYIWMGETTSVKDADVRRRELLEAALPAVREAAEKNVASLLRSPAGSKILLELIVSETDLMDDKLRRVLTEQVANCITAAALQGEDLPDSEVPGQMQDGHGHGNLLEDGTAMRTAKFIVGLTHNRSYSLGKILSSAMRRKLAKLNRGKGDLVLRKMATLEGDPFPEAERALKS